MIRQAQPLCERPDEAREASFARGLVELGRVCDIKTEDEFDDLVHAIIEGVSQRLPEFNPSEEAIRVAREQLERTTGFMACRNDIVVEAAADAIDKTKSASSPGRVPC